MTFIPYNPSDPGVTVADAVDYALTETDYKLGFALEDYLSDPDGTWQVGRYGLFPASEVYPSAPVTADDYRKLVLARFPMVQNVAVSADKKRCAYDFMLRLSPYFNDEDGIVKRIRSFLNRHRNLCEHIGRIEVGIDLFRRIGDSSRLQRHGDTGTDLLDGDAVSFRFGPVGDGHSGQS